MVLRTAWYKTKQRRWKWPIGILHHNLSCK